MNKEYHLIFDVGNSRISIAFFQQDMIVETAYFLPHQFTQKDLRDLIEDKKIAAVLIGSVNYSAGLSILRFFKESKIPSFEVTHEDLSIILDVETPEEVGADRIANTYGALCSHSGRDLIVIDMKEIIVFDVVARERRFLGGAIAVGPHLAAKALSEHTEKLPIVEISKPKSCLSKTTVGNIQSGIYFGMLGMTEKIIEEICCIHFGQGNVLVIATGSLTAPTEPEPDSSVFAQFRLDLEKDLKGIIHHFEPDLAFFGYHEILKEKLSKIKE